MADSSPKTDRERKIDWLIDRAEIEDVLASYARGIDRCDPQVLKAVYHPHGYDEHGIFSGPGYGFADFIIPAMLANYITMQHHFSTTSIDIRGIKASVESYFLCIMLANDRSLEFYGGRCLDQFEKIDGRWAIGHRQVVMDWTEVRRDIELPPIDSMFLKGEWGDKDASYRLLPHLRLGAFLNQRH
jgi:hypothetical protein